jgi:hypothetical protein
MTYIKADIPKELSSIEDDLKVIYHSKNIVFFLFFKIENEKQFIKSINFK